jgi:hypothetical protein
MTTSYISTLTQAEQVELVAQELMLAQANDLARTAASRRHDVLLAAVEASYAAEKAAIDAAYVAGVQAARLAIVAAR